jgi:predicted transposase/invertase (TIGR01784 family)
MEFPAWESLHHCYFRLYFRERFKNPQQISLRSQTHRARNQSRFFDKLTFVYLEMPRFKKQKHELHTSQDKWLYAIKNLSQLESIPEQLKNDIFERFFNTAEIAKLKPDEKQSYEQSLKYYRDLTNVITTAFDEGEAKGKAEGIAVGKAEGKAEGIALGEAKGFLKATLELKFTSIPVDDLTKINSADLLQLET